VSAAARRLIFAGGGAGDQVL